MEGKGGTKKKKGKGKQGNWTGAGYMQPYALVPLAKTPFSLRLPEWLEAKLKERFSSRELAQWLRDAAEEKYKRELGEL